MNGFTAADMSTAAANGHAEGYQAGYADAVKAMDHIGDANKMVPAAAQEAVGWQRSYKHLNGSNGPWCSVTKESYDETISGKWAHMYDVRQLYAAPVTAAPVEFDRARETPRRQTAVEAMLAMGFVWDNGAWRAQPGGDMQDERNRWFIRAGEYLKRAQAAESKLTSTPAAPVIDLREPEEAALWDRIERIREQALDASPKGGSAVVTDAMVHAALRVQYARAGSAWTGTEVNPDFVDMRNILTAAMQATSAEVGA